MYKLRVEENIYVAMSQIYFGVSLPFGLRFYVYVFDWFHSQLV